MDFDLAQLRALSATIAEGSFEAAARELHVTPSAVSQRIKALESAVGAVLVQRTKPVVVTESGKAVLRLARQIDILAADARSELGSDTGPGSGVTLPIAVNADSLATWILPALATVAGVTFDIHLDNQEHTTALLRSGTVMAAITAVAQPIQGCTSTPLGSMRYRPRCSAAFAAVWFGAGPSRAALDVAPLVVFDRKDDLQDAYLRQAGRPRPNPPRHYVPSSADFVRAVELGLGWGNVPDLQNTPGLVAFDSAADAVFDVPLYWQQWQLLSPTLDRVAAAVRDAAAGHLR